MTVESLLSAVRPHTAHYNAVKAAEQLFFSRKCLYTDIAPVACTSGQAEGKQKKDSDVKEAVSSAKKIAKDALKGKRGDNDDSKIVEDVRLLRKEVNELKQSAEELRLLLEQLQIAKKVIKEGTPIPAAPVVGEPKKEEAADDDDLDLFGSDDEEVDEEKEKLTQQRLAEYAAKKAKKPGPIAKSSVILDVKPWDDETDLEEMEKNVRSIEQDGLVWGGGKLIPLAYGIKKLQIICVIEDLKVSVDDLIEKITGDFDEYVQSVDIAAFNKI
ncbi:hypothetical protein QR680_017446 [Steinernema hermaphroditum]|uniref:Translation elongation factor EF1B beta/delta subunit guanine nucleotide exchange domain-containing protein n=1 Tax=Steinernema hermaphroditum TaxID=289476 RepID=A0AA39HEL2_9BILA|nr:hypothetical protein QR680_017446 [Steinernema hermaphroditum]